MLSPNIPIAAALREGQRIFEKIYPGSSLFLILRIRSPCTNEDKAKLSQNTRERRRRRRGKVIIFKFFFI